MKSIEKSDNQESNTNNCRNNLRSVQKDNSDINSRNSPSDLNNKSSAIEQAHDIILKIFSDQCDIQQSSATATNTVQSDDKVNIHRQLPKYDIAFQDMTSASIIDAAEATTSTTAQTTTSNNNSSNINNININNNSNTKLDNILKRLTGKLTLALRDLLLSLSLAHTRIFNCSLALV